MRRLAAATLVTLVALLGAAWRSAPGPPDTIAPADPVAPAHRPSLDLVLEYEPPVPRPVRPRPAVRAAEVAPASVAPRPAAPTEYVPPEPRDPAPPPAGPPRAVAVSAPQPDEPAVREAERPPGRAALVRRLLAIRERFAAGD